MGQSEVFSAAQKTTTVDRGVRVGRPKGQPGDDNQFLELHAGGNNILVE